MAFNLGMLAPWNTKLLDPLNLSGANDDTSWKEQQNYYRGLVGKPNTPTYQAAYNAQTMALSPFAQTDPRALNQFREEALRQGPSNWLQQTNARQDLLDLTARERARKEGAGLAAQGASRLAMSGGLSSGARERLQRDALRSAVERSQEIGRQGDLARQGASIQDEQNRIGQLGRVVSMQNEAIEPQLRAKQFDISQQVNEGTRQNEFNLNNYNEQMRAWAAAQQAGAIAGSGKKGSLLGLGPNGGKK